MCHRRSARGLVRAELASSVKPGDVAVYSVALVAPALTVGPEQLVLFAAGDFLGGLWTLLALRSEPASAT